MTLPYFNLYPRDYEADTSHLTLEEDGAYNRLLRLMWMTPGCSIPDDPDWIIRRMRITPETYGRVVAPLIGEFLSRAKGRLFSRRLQREFESAKATHEKRVQSGKKGGRPPKPLKEGDLDESRAKAGLKPGLSNQNQNQNHIIPLSPSNEGDSPPLKSADPEQPRQVAAKGTRLPSDWLPSETDRDAGLREGLTPQEVEREASKFRDFWIAKPGAGGVKLDWPATWRNWVRKAADERRRGRPALVAIPGGNRQEAGGLVGASLRLADRLEADRASR